MANSGGRPPKYKPEYVAQAKKLAHLGHTEVEMALFFEVSERTITRWKLEYPGFARALRVGKKAADERVVQALYKRAVGFSHESEKLFCAFGKIKRVKTVEQYPPDTKAALAWLWNRTKDWRQNPDPRDSDETPTPVKVTVEIKDARRGSG